MQRGSEAASRVEVFVEGGSTRTFAGVIGWPGWCRGGHGESQALQALLSCGPRYCAVVQALGLDCWPPVRLEQLHVSERVRGTATTDFGAPDSPLAGDARPIHREELMHMVWALTGCCRTFEAALEAGEGKDLRTGPRGGGRTLPAILEHVLGANGAYLHRLAWKSQPAAGLPLQRLRRMEVDILEALTAAAEGRLPASGPRGGKLWTARFFARRVAWHMLDHAWEIEDRLP